MPRRKPVGQAFSEHSDIIQSKLPNNTHDYSDSRVSQFSNQISKEEEDIEEPEIPHSPATETNRFTEIILVADTHYNPISEDQSPNPNWFIVTCDPSLINHTPLFYTPEDKGMTGVLVARGQLSIVNGQPILNKEAPASPLTSKEADDLYCSLTSFISEEEVAIKPFIFYENVEVSEIFTVFTSLTTYLTINNTTNNFNYNSNYLFNQQNNLSSFSSNFNFQNWSNHTNKFICNIFHNILPLEKDTEVDPLCSSRHHHVHPINEHLESEALIMHHDVIPIHQTIQFNASIQSNNININEETINNEVTVQSNKIIINEETLNNEVDDYGSAWKDVVIPNQNDEFKLSQIIDDSDNETFNKMLLDDKAMRNL